MPFYSPPQGPFGAEWEFQAGSEDPENGCFTADSLTAQQTSMIAMSGVNNAGSDSMWIGKVLVGSLVIFDSETGQTASFTIQSRDVSGHTELNVLWESGELTWGGKYKVQFSPRT